MTSLTDYWWPLVATAREMIIESSALWVPAVLIYFAVYLWFYYIRARWLNKKPWLLLEIKLPKQIDKTPQAMELALGAFYQTRDHGNLIIDSWLKGETRTWFALEIVSYSGDIHFYIRTDKFFKNLVESQLYAQYPNIEIFEVEDYVDRLPYNLPGATWDLWGTEFKLAETDALPIKTYIDYGMDKPIEEEYKIDPLTAMIEQLGTVGPGQQLWVQILVMAHKKRYEKTGTWFGKEGWGDQGKKLVDKLMKREKKKDDEKPSFGELMLSPIERRNVESVERNLSKFGFDCGIRGLYLYQKDKFTPLNIVGLLGAFKQYAAAGLNSFKASDFKTTFQYPWQDPFGWRLARRKRQIFDAYRRRSWFYPPYRRTPFVLSSEELATIFHLPGQVASTPTLAKIESKRAVPPENLPT